MYHLNNHTTRDTVRGGGRDGEKKITITPHAFPRAGL